MQVTKRSMNWVPKLSAYEEAMKLVEKRRKIATAFLADSQGSSSALAGVRGSQIASISQMSTYAVKARLAKLA